MIQASLFRAFDTRRGPSSSFYPSFLPSLPSSLTRPSPTLAHAGKEKVIQMGFFRGEARREGFGAPPSRPSAMRTEPNPTIPPAKAQSWPYQRTTAPHRTVLDYPFPRARPSNPHHRTPFRSLSLASPSAIHPPNRFGIFMSFSTMHRHPPPASCEK